MLGSAQVAVVGYIKRDTDLLLCSECAAAQEENGVNIHGWDWDPIISYTADEWASQNAYDRDPDAEIEEYDYPECEGCGKAIGA